MIDAVNILKSETENSLVKSSAEQQSRTASFPMYDFPHLTEAHNLLWNSIARTLRSANIDDVPQLLTREKSLNEVWNDPQMLLSQTCGFPLAKHLKASVRLVATPRYTAFGCRRARYRSCIVVRADENARVLSDMRGRRCAVNELSSNSGMNVFRAAIAPIACGEPFFEKVMITGSHAESLRSVAENRADVAAIDCVSFAHIRTLSPELTNAVKILTWTRESPSLPFVTSRETDDYTLAALRHALTEVTFDPGLASVRDALMIDGFELVPLEQYQPILEMEHYAMTLRYPQIC
jgi:ABC-type phosphate/phosphonate transport system substrate-binding protein